MFADFLKVVGHILNLSIDCLALCVGLRPSGVSLNVVIAGIELYFVERLIEGVEGFGCGVVTLLEIGGRGSVAVDSWENHICVVFGLL